MRRIAVVTQAVAYIVTAVLLVLAVGLLATSNASPRDAIPELLLLAVALIAHLVAARPYVDADASSDPAPVDVQLTDKQVDLVAMLIDSAVLRAAGQHPRPIPNGVNFPQSGERGVMVPPQVRETKLPRKGARHASSK